MSESDLNRAIMLAAPQFGSRLLRNSVGVFIDTRGNYVKYGLTIGSSDLIGWTETLITQDMVGRTVAVFTAVECKLPGKQPTESQRKFLCAVQKAGGIATLAYSTEDVKHAIQAYADASVHHPSTERGALPVDFKPPSFSLDK